MSWGSNHQAEMYGILPEYSPVFPPNTIFEECMNIFERMEHVMLQ